MLVNDQDDALDFYIEALGFETRDDVETDEGRWLTVAPAGVERPQFVLMPADSDAQRERIGSQTGDYMAFVLATDDCRGDYETLRERGVSFAGEPEEMPWGIEVGFEDPDGNRYDLVEPRPTSGIDAVE